MNRTTGDELKRMLVERSEQALREFAERCNQIEGKSLTYIERMTELTWVLQRIEVYKGAMTDAK